mgnify:CR=1 FL=1
MDNPMLLLINVVFLCHLLFDVFVHLCEIYYEIVYYWEIFVLDGVYCLSNGVLVSKEVPLLKIHIFLDDILEWDKDIFFDL